MLAQETLYHSVLLFIIGIGIFELPGVLGQLITTIETVWGAQFGGPAGLRTRSISGVMTKAGAGRHLQIVA